MMIHPEFNPIAIGPYSIGTFNLAVHWYGLMYMVAFIAFVLLAKYRIKHKLNGAGVFNSETADDVLFYGAIGVILGGRLGYVLFYKPAYYLAHPSEILALWQGGMSFHGGFLGVVLAICFFAWRKKLNVWVLGDMVAACVAFGLAAGRMGNFINGELWGRVTDATAPWAMVFPQAGDPAGVARHPSQLYQFGLEGIALFIATWYFARKDRPAGAVIGFFIAGYGVCRFIAEFAREPDAHLGLLNLGFLNLGLTMGQWLSLPMIAVGLGGVVYAYRKRGNK